MQAYEVISFNARQVKLIEQFHTKEAAAKECASRQSLMHTGVKVFEVTVKPLPPDAMTKSNRSAKAQAVRT